MVKIEDIVTFEILIAPFEEVGEKKSDRHDISLDLIREMR